MCARNESINQFETRRIFNHIIRLNQNVWQLHQSAAESSAQDAEQPAYRRLQNVASSSRRNQGTFTDT